MKGTASPLILCPQVYESNIQRDVEMKISEIVDALTPAVVARGCFIVEINISKDNDIEFVIEKEEGSVDLDDCVEISNVFGEKFSRDAEDYSLTVTSAGLDQPFKVLKQYIKAVGSDVEVSLKGGKKLVARLVSADENGISISYSAREAVPGKKKKEMVEHNESLPYAEITSVRPHIVFE